MENGHSVVELDVVYMDIATFTGYILMRPLLPKMSFPRKAKHKDDGSQRPSGQARRLGRECFIHRLRLRFTCGTPSIRLIDCSLPGLLDPGDVIVADVDGGIYVCVHSVATLSADIPVPLS